MWSYLWWRDESYHDLERTSTDTYERFLMTHLPRFDISRKYAAEKTRIPDFVAQAIMKWHTALRNGCSMICCGKVENDCAAKLANHITLRNCAKSEWCNQDTTCFNYHERGYLTVFYKDSCQYLWKTKLKVTHLKTYWLEWKILYGSLDIGELWF